MYNINSSIWLGIKCHLNLPLEGTRRVVRRGDKINYQNDNLLGEPLGEILEIPCANRKQFSTKVENLIEEHKWTILNFIMLNYSKINTGFNKIHIPHG